MAFGADREAIALVCVGFARDVGAAGTTRVGVMDAGPGGAVVENALRTRGAIDALGRWRRDEIGARHAGERDRDREGQRECGSEECRVFHAERSTRSQ